MRKLLFTFLAVILVVSVLAVPAHADSATITIEPSNKSDVHPGEEITFTLTLNNSGSDLGSLSGKLSATEGLEIQHNTANVLIKSEIPSSTYNEGTGLSCSTMEAGVTKTPLDIMEITCKVSDNATAGEKKLTFTVDICRTHDNSDLITAQTKFEATVTVVHDSKVESEDHDWPDAPTSTQAPTCTVDGWKKYKCKGCNVEKEETDPALGHDITFGEFQWTNGSDKTNDTAKINVKCAHDYCTDYYESGSGKDVDATVTSDPGEATCTEPGTVKYHAEIVIDDPKFKDSKEGFADGKWTKTDDTHTQEVEKLGHDYTVEEDIDWSQWDPENPTNPFDVTWACKTCGTTITTQATAVQEGKNQPANCETEKEIQYKATANFSGKDSNEPENADLTTPKEKTLTATGPALGHEWADAPTFSWSGSSSEDVSATATMKCNHEGCDQQYDSNPLSMTVDVKQSKVTTPAQCETEGKATYTATATNAKVNDGKAYTEDKTEITLAALGHDWQKPVFQWTETPGAYTVTVTRTCGNGENCDLTGGEPQEPMEAVTPTSQEDSKPTYEKEGQVTWSATAKFKKDKADSTGESFTETKVETVAKLEPETTADVQTPAGVKTDAVAEELTEQFDTLVKDALTAQEAPAGMPKEVFEAIKLAGESETDGSLSVSTNLVVEQPKTEPTVTGVDAASVLDAYDIRIEMTVTGDKLDKEVTGYITETSELITFTLPKPTTGGPIFYMMTDHGGTWKRIDSTVQGSSIVFSTQEFSNFVIVGSNSLADAEVADIADQAYTGSALEPDVKVTINGGATTLVKGTDYEVVYENNTAAGTAKVTIKGIGSYTGELTAQFTILPPAATARPNSPAATKDPNVPATGDETPLALYATALVVCAAALGLVLVLLRRRHEK